MSDPKTKIAKPAVKKTIFWYRINLNSVNNIYAKKLYTLYCVILGEMRGQEQCDSCSVLRSQASFRENTSRTFLKLQKIGIHDVVLK